MKVKLRGLLQPLTKTRLEFKCARSRFVENLLQSAFDPAQSANLDPSASDSFSRLFNDYKDFSGKSACRHFDHRVGSTKSNSSERKLSGHRVPLPIDKMFWTHRPPLVEPLEYFVRTCSASRAQLLDRNRGDKISHPTRLFLRCASTKSSDHPRSETIAGPCCVDRSVHGKSWQMFRSGIANP